MVQTIELEEDDTYYFDEASADYACEWIETNCVLTTDKWAGKPFILADWQRDDIIRPAFGWRRKDSGLRRFKRVIVWIPRKNGKTELAAAVSLLVLLATGVVSGEVYSIAADKDQAKIVFDKASRMVAWSPPLTGEVEPLKNSLFVPALMAKFEPLSGQPEGKHGKNASGLIGDEVHEWKDDRLYTFIHQSSGGREEPIEFLISTAGLQDGYGWELWQECEKILDGTIEDPETLVVIYAADPEEDWTDPEVWKQANPNLGVSPRLDYMETECRRAQESPRLENDFKRYHLNLWTGQDVRWLPMDLWKKCSEDPANLNLWRDLPERMKGRRAFAGIDLASVHDITAAVFVFPPENEGERWVLLPQFWVPEETVQRRTRQDRVPYESWVQMGAIKATSGAVVDYAFLKKETYDRLEDYPTRKVAIDRWNASQIKIEMEQDGVPIENFGQGYQSMTAPSKELERLVMSGLLEHGNHPVLTWMANNAAYDQDPAGNIKPSKQKSKEKIDGIAASVMGIGVAMTDDGTGGPSVYKKRGLLIL